MFLNDLMKKRYDNRLNLVEIYTSNSAAGEISETTLVPLAPLGIQGPYRRISSSIRTTSFGGGDTWTARYIWKPPSGTGEVEIMTRVLTGAAFGECTMTAPFNAASKLAIPGPTHLELELTVNGGTPALRCDVYLTTAI
jgi:hypothetical protein